LDAKKLEWDSRFFGTEVYGVELPVPAAAPGGGSTDMTNLMDLMDPTDLTGLVGSLRAAGAGLVYFFLQEKDRVLQDRLTGLGARLMDEKITYSKILTGGAIKDPKEVEAYDGEPTDKLLELAFLAGQESRFKKDPRLSSFFEPMYRLWMINSLNGSIADRVFVYRSGDTIDGMVTCKIRENRVGNIGLIAASPGQQGKGIGKALLQAVDSYFRINDLKTSTVVTQKTNEQACRFYEAAGFSVYKTEYVYHLWFN
jgi:dTDP-4-amino-4,6-dideoxy-D-galactose acyltransferase